MNNTIIVFPDSVALSDFIFSRRLPNAEVSTQQCSVTAPMEEDDIIEAVSDHNGYVTHEWPPVYKPKC